MSEDPLRSNLIRLAASMPKGSPNRKALLNVLAAFMPGHDIPKGWKYRRPEKWSYGSSKRPDAIEVQVDTDAPGAGHPTKTTWVTSIRVRVPDAYHDEAAFMISALHLVRRLAKALGIRDVKVVSDSGILIEEHASLTPRELDKFHSKVKAALQTFSDETDQVVGFKWPIKATFEVFLQSF